MQTIRDVKLSSKQMNVFSIDSLGRGRSIVRVTIGCFLALAAIVCVVGSRVSRFGPDWHWWSGISASARSERAKAVVANTSSDADAALFAAHVLVLRNESREASITSPDDSPKPPEVYADTLIRHATRGR